MKRIITLTLMLCMVFTMSYTILVTTPMQSLKLKQTH